MAFKSVWGNKSIHDNALIHCGETGVKAISYFYMKRVKYLQQQQNCILFLTKVKIPDSFRPIQCFLKILDIKQTRQGRPR